MMFILAHYWGIDEVGVFVIPALVAIWSLRWAERRARKNAEQRKLHEDVTEEPTDVD
jgi:hypothetical protein